MTGALIKPVIGRGIVVLLNVVGALRSFDIPQ